MNSSLSAALKVVEALRRSHPEKWVERATLAALIKMYDVCWAAENERFVVRECEVALAAPLYNIRSGKARRSHVIAGKIDKIVETGHPSFLTIFDHKTTSSDISPEANYWRQLNVDTQPKHYMLLARTRGYPVGRVVWDAVRKPQLRPSKIKAKSVTEISEEGTYLTLGVTDNTQRLVRDEGLREENEELFEIRTYAKLCEDPNKYFQRRSVTPLMEELADHVENVIDVSYDMAAARKRYRNESRVVKNPGACMQYNTPCKYLGVCSGHSSFTDAGWETRDHKFPELPELEGKHERKVLLTHSSMRCFQACPAKHQFQYEQGFYRSHEEASPALFFGTVWHEIMDAWWTAEKGGADE
mgnify:CR=1 FL=1